MDYSSYMGQSFTKLFSSITDSTIWSEPDHVRIVWITLLASADARGRVFSSVPGLAVKSRVTMPLCIEALEKLMAPDGWSRTKTHEGRRLEPIEGGWRLINYSKYRELRDEESTKAAKRDWWNKNRGLDAKLEKLDPPRTDSNQEEEEEEEEEEIKKNNNNAVANESEKKKTPSRKRNKNFEIAATNLPDDVQEAFSRCWNGWPKVGYNFQAKSNQPRRINKAKAAENFFLVCQNLNLATEDGTPVGPSLIADAALAWVDRLRETTYKKYGNDVAPPVPCIANFFSADPASKKHWQEAIVEHFGV